MNQNSRTAQYVRSVQVLTPHHLTLCFAFPFSVLYWFYLSPFYRSGTQIIRFWFYQDDYSRPSVPMQSPQYLVLKAVVLVSGMDGMGLPDYHSRNNRLDVLIHGGGNHPEETLHEIFSDVISFIG